MSGLRPTCPSWVKTDLPHTVEITMALSPIKGTTFIRCGDVRKSGPRRDNVEPQETAGIQADANHHVDRPNHAFT